MIEQSVLLKTYLWAVLCLLLVAVVFCLIRALKGPRITDRVVALNVIGTIVVLMICILSYLLGESFLIDVAILYAMLNLVGVIVLCRAARERHYELKRKKEEHRD